MRKKGHSEKNYIRQAYKLFSSTRYSGRSLATKPPSKAAEQKNVFINYAN